MSEPKFKSGKKLLEDSRTREFINTVRSQCRKCNVRFVMANAEFVGGRAKNEQLLGFFWEPSLHRTGSELSRYRAGELKVATKNIPPNEWLVTLAHEYAHFLQWFRDDPVYTYSTSYLEMEIVTEREALALLKRFDLPLDYTAVKRKSKEYIAKIRREEKEMNA